ncbi:MAG TPA: helix-turn-helix domain-containing protein [Gemmatimonadales bacterium]|nr:helix-turn-helix domain-containing protein [Gemmatimonadales bacterium]
MPRIRPHDRIDKIADAATEIFIRNGYAPAKISQIAERAKVGPGTIYLYAAGKEALFDLALRRAMEDPTVWSMSLPHPAPASGAVADALWRCLQNAAHFPQLWLAAESPPPDNVTAEMEGIVLEMYRWLHRYRRAIELVQRSAGDWPDVAQVFYRRFWRGGVHRVADYFARRVREGVLPARGDGLAAAHLVIESLTWMAVHREWSPDGGSVTAKAAEQTAVALLVPALCGDPT